MEKHNENIFFLTLWVIFFFLCAAFLYDINWETGSSVNEFINLESVGKVVHVEGGENIPNRNFFTANLPRHKVTKPYLAMKNMEITEIRLNGHKYMFDDAEQVSIKNNVWNFIPLPEDMKGGEISLTLKNEMHTAISLKSPGIYFGTRSYLLGNLAVPSSIYLVLCAVVFVLGLLSLFADIILKMYKINWHFSYLGFGVICFSVWIFSLSSVSIDIFDGISTDFIQCSVLFIVPVLLFRFISAAFTNISGRLFTFLSAFHFMLLILAGSFIVANKVHFYQIEPIMWFIFVSSLLQCICRLGAEMSEHKEARSLYICITIMFFTCFGYLLFCNFRPTTALRWLIAGTSAILCYGIFVFIKNA